MPSCSNSNPTLDDIIDNDCDGVIDEELLDGIDNDGDGLVDEDISANGNDENGLVDDVIDEVSEDLNWTGTYFILAFGANINRAVTFFITTTCEEVVDITVKAPRAYPNNTLVTATAVRGNITTLVIRDVDFEITIYRDGLGSAGVEITASADISIYSINGAEDDYRYVEAMLHLPVVSTGLTYDVISRYDDCECCYRDDSFLTIVATENESFIELSNIGAELDCFDDNLGTFNVTLQQFQTFYCEDRGVISGIHVSANKPVAVFSGIDYTSIVYDNIENHLTEQLLPVQHLGRKFAVVPSPFAVNGDIVRIMASYDSTVFRCTPDICLAMINKGEFLDLSINSNQFFVIDSNKPINIMKFPKGSPEDTIGTPPFMGTVLPLKLYGNDFHIPVVSYNSELNYTFVVTIIIDSRLKSGLSINNAPITVPWITLPKYNLVTAYINVNEGLLEVKHKEACARFMVTLTVLADNRVAYELLGATNHMPFSKSVPNPGDVLDNDCDGVVDEEIEDELDNDGDGLIDEDLETAVFCKDEETLCEKRERLLQCPSGTVHILDAFYGRLDGTTCSEGVDEFWLRDQSCDQDREIVKAALKSRCDGRSSCTIYSRNSYLNGDPCAGTLKYLKYCYTCA